MDGDGAGTAVPARSSASRRRAIPPGLRRELGPLALVVGVVVAANILYLAGIFDADPMGSFAAVGSVVHAGLLSGQYQIDPNAGYTAQSLGHLAAVDLLHGHLPWWNPYEGMGAPLAGEMQGAALFPGTLLLWFRDGQVWLHVLLEALTGVATLRLLRRLDCGRWVAAGLACAFALCGTFAWYAQQPTNEILFLPLLVLGIERAREAAAGTRRLGYAMVAVALALSVYAGFPETAYLDGLLAALWAVARTAGLERRSLLRYGTNLVAGAGAGVLLAAPVAVAFADYVPHGALGPHAGGVFDLVHMSHVAVGGLVFPYLFGPIFGFSAADPSGTLQAFWSQVGGFVAISVLFLDVVALFARRHRALRVALVAWLVVALGRTYGLEPFWRLFDLLPFMGHVGAYRYLSPAVSFAAVVLGALGADDLRRGEVPRWAAAVALFCSAGAALAAALSGWPVVRAISGAPGASSWATGSLAWGFSVLALLGVAAIVLRGRWRTAMVLGCVVADALGMYVTPELSAPRAVSYDTHLVAFLERHDATGRFFTLGPVQPNYGSYFGAMEADVNDLPIPKAYHRYVARHLDTNTTLQFTGTVVRNPTGPSPFAELVAHLGAYEAIGVRDVVAFTGTIPRSTAATLGLRQVYRDRFATVYATPHPAPYYRASDGCALSHRTIASVQVRCTAPGTLVRSALFMPGWSATTGSGKVLSVRAATKPGPDLAQSVRVPAGTTTVHFSYTPPHEGAALGALCVGAGIVVVPPAVVSVGGLPGVAGLAGLGARRRRRRGR